MADPCVDDTPTIELLTAGDPAILTANVRNPADTFSGTAGDDTTHNVNDNNTPHTLAQTWNIANGPNGGAPTASARCKGIVVCQVNPIFVHATGVDVTLEWFARLIVGGVLADERDCIATGLDIPAGTSQLVSPGGLVGQIDLAIGADVDVDLLLSIENIGASGTWTFRFGGSKMVANLGW